MAGLAELVRRRSGDCDAVAAALPAWVAGETPLDDRAIAHVSQCLRCQADAARYRRMLRTLHELRRGAEPPPPGVVGDIIARLDAAERRSGALRWVLLGMAAGAGTLGAAAVLVRTGRRRLFPAVRAPVTG